MNSWDDAGFRKAIEATGKKNIIMTGLWTEVCVTWPTIEMLGAGYNIYVVEDCCGATSPAAQEAALSRMVQAGAVRLTTIAALLEWQRDWAKQRALQRAHGHSQTTGAALTASASNTPTRWFTTRRSRRRSRRSCRRRRRIESSRNRYATIRVVRAVASILTHAHPHRHHPSRAARLRSRVSAGAARVLSNVVRARRRAGRKHAHAAARFGLARIRHPAHVRQRAGARCLL